MNKKFANILKFEQGTIVKKTRQTVETALIFPNTYHVAMSNLAVHFLYSQINHRPDASCERIFYMQDLKYPLSLENQRQFQAFDILFVTVSFEPDYINLIKMLRASCIEMYALNRTLPLIIMGGVMAKINYKPLMDFVDAIVIGDAEITIDRILDICARFNKHKIKSQKLELLARFAQIPGVYVPQINNTCLAHEAANFDDFCLHSQIITPNTEFNNSFLIEISRGCARKCKFCVLGAICSGVRYHSLDKVLAQAKQGMTISRHIGLVGAAVSDYPAITALTKELQKTGCEISTSSLRLDSTTRELIENLFRSGQRTITFAPETGSEKLRAKIGKPISDAELVNKIKIAANIGIKSVKLYFMVGLPEETNEDIDALINLVKKISGFIQVKVSITAFVPKPHTILKNACFIGKEEFACIIKHITKSLANCKNIAVTVENYRLSKLQYIIDCAERDYFYRTGSIV